MTSEPTNSTSPLATGLGEFCCVDNEYAITAAHHDRSSFGPARYHRFGLCKMSKSDPMYEHLSLCLVSPAEAALEYAVKRLSEAMTVALNPTHSTTVVQTQAIVKTWHCDDVRAWVKAVLSCSDEHVADVWLEGGQLVTMTPAEVYEQILDVVGETDARIIEDALTNKLWNLHGFAFRCALAEFLCVAKFYWTEPLIQNRTLTVLQGVITGADRVLAEIISSEGVDAIVLGAMETNSAYTIQYMGLAYFDRRCALGLDPVLVARLRDVLVRDRHQSSIAELASHLMERLSA